MQNLEFLDYLEHLEFLALEKTINYELLTMN
jgi:hypothetical protein